MILAKVTRLSPPPVFCGEPGTEATPPPLTYPQLGSPPAHTFPFSLRLHRVVKLSSPYLNVLIIVGVIMFYVDVILFGVDERTASRSTVNALCMVRTTDILFRECCMDYTGVQTQCNTKNDVI